MWDSDNYKKINSNLMKNPQILGYSVECVDP